MIDRPLGHLVATVNCSLYVRSPGLTTMKFLRVGNAGFRAKTSKWEGNQRRPSECLFMFLHSVRLLLFLFCVWYRF